ncbi:nucleotidyltransferase family protein [Hanstruepera flava]|uniref:nucleotidyltransferase family protein n=1 Tax=Hanstruepera flava TaxID=2930218 RepID=UPI002028C791|nr:nucleotidyltransferase family protein [Hanstruepera flava]
MPNITHIILAAGSSSRMGKLKQLLPWKGTFLLDYVIDKVMKTTNNRVILVLGSNYDQIKTKLGNKAIDIVINEEWDKGLGASIAKGVSAALKDNKPEAILTSLVDQPLIPENYFTEMISAFKGTPEQIIASDYGHDKLGVPALFGANYFNDLMTLQTDKGAKSIILKNRIHVDTINAKEFLSDLDTTEDYQKLYAANHQ